MWRLLFFIILIILFRRISRTLQEQQKEQQKEPSEEKIKDLFQTLGFPPPEEVSPQPRIEKPKEPIIVKRKIKRPGVKMAELKPTKIEIPPKQIEEIKEELLVFSQDKLEEGIILSAILGPPKAYQMSRGGGIGIRAGLKNR